MRLIILLPLIFIASVLFAQNDTHKKTSDDSKFKPKPIEINTDKPENVIINDKEKIEEYNVASFVLNLGAWIPLGNMQETFNVNTNYGVRFGIKINPRIALQLGLSLFVPKSSAEFEFKLDSTVYMTSAENKTNGYIGAWINHFSASRNKKVMFEKYIGIGAAFIQTDIPNYDSKNQGDEFYSMKTVNLSFGVVISKITRGNSRWGWFIEYDFAPYYTSGHVETSFGSSSLVSGLQFGF